VENITQRAAGYGIPGVGFYGNDVLEVYKAAEKAVERARAGEGPTLLVGETYRWTGHNYGEPGIYRAPEEVTMWKEDRDPITTFNKYLIKEGIAKAEELTAIEQEIMALVEKAAQFALQSPEPAIDSILDNVYA
jgi:Pyruvate/2-oxoglutarate dehydrogenase complex, dehydrogenase (E1) component, eukaryotic type, alpha subunit